VGTERVTDTSTSAPETSGTQLRLAELVASLSLAVDLGFDQPMEHVLRQTEIALRLADRLGLDDETRASLYYTSLLVNVGCHADAHEQTKWFGDDIALKSTKYDHDFRSFAGMVSGLRAIGAGNPPLHRLRVGLAFALGGHREMDSMIAGHAELASRLADRLGLSEETRSAVGSSYERWDGHGWPGLLAGDQIPRASRISQLAEYVEVAHRLGGPQGAAAMARDRRGRQFDPELASLVETEAETLLAGVGDRSSWRTVIDAEPLLRHRLRGAAIDEALTAVADFVDLKTPFTLGHSAAVAALAAGAGRVLTLPDEDVDLLGRAGLVHDVGRLGVSNAIWEKQEPLGAGEWERIRMYPYLTERILHQSAPLARLGAVAVQHRERLDGSGYPQGLMAPALSVVSRTLAAADAYRTWREPRPHRAALSEAGAAARLRAEARAGRLDHDVVEAVLAAAGHSVDRRHSRPAGLSPREIEILRLIARGLSSREIAQRLTLSPKTVRNHTEHIYAKTGAANRVTAGLFAVEHGLLPVE
jgi:HD-GYP domain-containing protein (c-di-GMP phosphodiesterase class II)